MSLSVSQALKSRKFTKKTGYCSYDFVVNTARQIWGSVNALHLPYDFVLQHEEECYTSLFHQQKPRIQLHEGYDFMLLEAINSRFAYPVFCVNKDLCEALYNTAPMSDGQVNGHKKIPIKNLFVEKGIVLMPREINGIKPKSAAFIFNAYEGKVIAVCYLGWDLGARGAEMIALPKIEGNELLTLSSSSPTNSDIDFLSNLFLYQDSIKDRSEENYAEMIPAYKKGFAKTTSKKSMLSPRVIGDEYKPKSVRADKSTGTHCSPCTHWRSGHWRQQPTGKRDNPQHKTIWIEPLLVNAGNQTA